MDKKYWFSRSLAALAIFFAALVFVQYRRGELINRESLSGNSYARMPAIQLRDWRGDTLDLGEVRDRVIYIHFLDPLINRDLDFFTDAYLEWNQAPVQFLLFCPNPEVIVNKFPVLNNRVRIFDLDIDKMRTFLRSDKGFSFCYLYDRNRNFIFRTLTYIPYKYGMGYEMRKLIRGERFRPEEFWGQSQEFWQMEPLDRIREAFLAHDKDVLIIVFLSSFCDNCNEGTLLREIKLLYESGRTDVAAVLYETFTENDAKNFKSQLGLGFSTELATKELLSRWRSLIEKYSPVEMGAIVLAAARKGNILWTYSPGCECFDQTVRRLRDMR